VLPGLSKHPVEFGFILNYIRIYVTTRKKADWKMNRSRAYMMFYLSALVIGAVLLGDSEIFALEYGQRTVSELLLQEFPASQVFFILCVAFLKSPSAA